MNVTPELVTMDDGTYRFIANGMQIDNPFHQDGGHDSCTPDYYGFTVFETGGGCTAWRRDFTLHGVPVYMLLTAADDAHHHVVDGEDFGVGVYVDGDSDAFVNWTMRYREVDGYSELMAESITRQGTMPTETAEDMALGFLWQRWCAKQGLPCLSADEMDHNALTVKQRAFVAAFIAVWDEVVS